LIFLLVTAVYRVSGNNVENRHLGLSRDPVSLKSFQVLAGLENNQWTCYNLGIMLSADSDYWFVQTSRKNNFWKHVYTSLHSCYRAS